MCSKLLTECLICYFKRLRRGILSGKIRKPRTARCRVATAWNEALREWRIPMKRFALMAAAAVVGLGSMVQAASVNVGGPNDGWNPPGNNGQTNGNFQVSSSGGSELGLRAQLRTLGQIAPVGTVYTAPAGKFGGGGPADDFAKWNFDFSVVLAANSGVERVILKIDTDPSNSTLFSTVELGGSPTAAVVGQNSWNVKMAFLGLNTFDVNAPGLYDFELVAFGTGNALLNSVAMQVQVIPLPLASTAGMALVGMMGLRRRA